MDSERRLLELGLELPQAATPIASYVPVVVSGTLAFVAGQVAMESGTPLWTGHLGRDVDVATGAEAARRCALQALAALRAELGSLDRISRIVKVTVFVASAEGFTALPQVANGASDVLVEVFGEPGRHARVAVGVSELPLAAPVEVELMVEVEG